MASTLRPFRRKLENLYVVKALKLEDIRKLMKEEHSIDAGRSSYERLFKEWGLRKTKKTENWRWVSYEIQKQERNGQKSDLYINGKHIPREVVQKEISRHVTTLEQALHRANAAPSPKRPSGYIILTPGQQWNTAISLHTLFPCPIYIPDNGIVKIEAVTYSGRNKDDDPKTLNLEDVPMLFRTLLDCCAFITMFDSRTHTSSSEMWEVYISTARIILIVSESPQDYIVRAKSAFSMISFDILVSTYRDDMPAVQKILKTLNISRHKESRYGKIILASLFLAIWKGSPELVTTLRNALPGEPRDGHGRTCLYLASTAARLDVVRGLIQSGADVNALCPTGSIRRGSLQDLPNYPPMCQPLLQAGARTVPILTDMDALCQAAANGQVGVVRDLLCQRPELAYRPPSGWAPLHWAANTKVIQVLLDAGAYINHVADTNETPLDVHFHSDSKRTLLVANGGKTSYALTCSERSRAHFEPYG